MNDIEILEKLEKVFAELRKDDKEGHSSAYELQWEDINAIENLINRVKELEEIEKEHQKINGELQEKIKFCKVHNLPENVESIVFYKEDFERNFGNDFISKDKIKEKIEELEKECEECRFSGQICEEFLTNNQCTITKCKTILHDLLEE